ncbi:hypothetical protein Q7P35_005427 [Cladosporium inversicolor]
MRSSSAAVVADMHMRHFWVLARMGMGVWALGDDRSVGPGQKEDDIHGTTASIRVGRTSPIIITNPQRAPASLRAVHPNHRNHLEITRSRPPESMQLIGIARSQPLFSQAIVGPA